jgi:PKD repeat protein
MKKGIFFISVFTIIFAITLTVGWAVPREERQVRFMNDKFGRDIKKLRIGEYPYFKSAPAFNDDKDQNFRNLHAREWNVVSHRFAIQPDFSSFEEAARSYLSEYCYGPRVGLNDESKELVFVDKKIINSDNNSDNIYYSGRCFIRFRQVYNQIPVIGSEVIVEMNNRFELLAIVARIIYDIDTFIESSKISLEPAVSFAEAETFAKNQMKVKYQISDINNIYTESHELGLYNQYVMGHPGSGLVWKFVLTHGNQKELVLVSASISFSHSIVAMIPFCSEYKFLYHGKTGAICDVLNNIIQDIQNTPGTQPSRLGSPLYRLGQDKEGDIFINSGVGNKAAYMLIKGDTFNGKTVEGIGFEKTKNLFDEAQNLLPMTSDYFDLYFALLQGCINLGYSYAECDQVMDVVNATEMDLEPSGYTPVHGINDKPECASDSALNSIFYDNFDSDINTNWQIIANQGEALGAIPQYKSTIGFAQSFANSQPGNIWGFAQTGISDVRIEMTVDTDVLPPNAYLFFNHAFIFDDSDSNSTHFNGGIIEYSTDSGASWHDKLIFDKNAYNGIINASSNPLNGKNAFVSKSDGYMATIIDLHELEGSRVRFRFRIATSANTSFLGWFIDDFQVYSCDMFLQIPAFCANPTVTSTSDGNFSQIPGPNDIVKIQAGHSVTINSLKNFRGLCNYGHIQSSKSDLVIETSDFIYNVGKIWADDGQDGYWTNGFNRYEGAGEGKNVELTSSVIYNDVGGDIQAGRGGHSLAVTTPYYVEKRVDSIGGDGGDVSVSGDYIKNTGRIGPDKLIDNYTYKTLPDDLVPDQNVDGGNGGIGDNGFWSSTYCPNSVGRDHCANFGTAEGGKGGDINISATISIEHYKPGTIGGGNGGLARGAQLYLFWNDKNRIPGIGGNVIVTSPKTYINSDIAVDTRNNDLIKEFGGNIGGNIRWDPIMTIGGDSARITGVEKLQIFGGRDWVLDLSKLTPEAFSANEVEIKLGSRGIVDLGNTDNIVSAYSKVTLYVNEENIITDGDSSRSALARKIARTFDSQIIEVYAPEIEYEFEIDIIAKDSTLKKRRDISAEKNTTQELYVTLNNNGPTRDAYALKVSYSNLIQVSSIPSFVRLNSMSRKKVPVEVTLPEEAGDNYFVEVIAESCSTISKRKSKRINFSVDSTIATVDIINNKDERLKIEANGMPLNEGIVVTDWQWDMGDNSLPISGQNISYTYPKEGSYIVKLTVTDSLGNTETIQKEVVVQNSKVLLIAADSTSRAKLSLISTGLFVDSDIATIEHPSTLDIDQLMPYNAVLVWSSKEFHNTQNLGEVLSKFIENGGGVVIAGYSFIHGLHIESNLQNLQLDGTFAELYYPFVPALPQNLGLRDPAFSINIEDVSVPNHFVFSGITQNPSYFMDPSQTAKLELNNESILLAKDNLGNNIVALHPTKKVIAMAMLPTFLGNESANLLMANALLHVSGETSELVVTQNSFDKGASAGNDAFQIIDKGNGTMFWSAKTDDYWIHIEGENSGVSSGIINFSYDAYSDPDNIRVGKIVVSALGAYNSPQIIQITQGQNQVPELFDIPDQAVCEDSEIDIPITVTDAETLALDLIVRARADNTNLVPDSGIRFSNPGKERTLTIRPAPNLYGSTMIAVTVSDGIRSTTKTFRLTIKPVNDAPYFTKGYDIVLTRGIDTGAQTIENWIVDVSPGFSNEVSQVINYHVQPQNADQFDVAPSIDPNGTLTFNPKDDFADFAVVSVYATDNGGTIDGGSNQSEPQLFTIYYADEVPDFDVQHKMSVLEDAGQQIIPNWATQIDPGTNDTDIDISFMTFNSNPDLFSENPQILDDGTLVFTTAPDKNGIVIMTTYLKDNKRVNKLSSFKHFIIFIMSVNDSPSFVGNSHNSLEDAPRQYVKDFAQDIDKGPEDESDQSVTFHIQNCSNPDLFEEMPAVSPDGTLTYKSKPDAFGEAILSIVITDDGSENTNGNTEQCKITVKPVNDPPSFLLGQFPDYISEDAGHYKMMEWAKNISPGPENEQDQTPEFIVENDNPSLFKIQPTISSEGNLEFETAPNAYGTAKVSIHLDDKGGAYDGGNNISQIKSFVMTVRPVCDPLTFVLGPDQIVDNPGRYTISNWATIAPGTNEDSFLKTFTYSNSLSDVDVYPDGSLAFTILPNQCGVFQVTVNLEYQSPCNGINDFGLTTKTFYITHNCVDSFSLSIDRTGSGKIFLGDSELTSVPWSGLFEKNQEITLAAEDSATGKFTNWIDSQTGNILSAENPYIFTINQHMNIKADFETYTTTVCFEFDLHKGFNPVSLPVSPLISTVSDLFGSPSATAYIFTGTNYVPKENMLTQSGYWLEIHEDKKLTICGPPLHDIQLNLSPGFHFIGGVSTKQIPYTIPSGNIESIYILKDGAYKEVSEMLPGIAHWVKIKAQSLFILNDQ